MGTNRSYYILFSLILVLGIFLRLYNLNTTYPLDVSFSQGIYNDEGVLASNARSKVLFGKWVTDENSYSTPYFLLPVYNFLVYATFSIFDVGLVQLRGMHVFVFVLSYFLIYLVLLRDKIKPAYILFALCIYSFSVLNILYGRVGFTENPMVLFMGISIYLYMLSEQNSFYAFMSGVFCTLGILTKTYALILAPILFLDSVIRLFMNSSQRRSKYIRISVYFVLGGIICGGIFVAFHFYPHLNEVLKCVMFEKDPTGTHVPSLKNILFSADDIWNMGTWHIVFNLLWIPGVVSIFFMFILSLGKGFFNRDRIEGKAIVSAVFIAIVILFLSMGYKPPRRILLLIFPGSIISAYFLDAYFKMKRGNRFLITSSVFIFPIFCSLSKFLGIKYNFIFLDRSNEERIVFIGIILVIILAVILLVFKKYISLSPRKAVLLFTSVFFACNVFYFIEILNNSTPWIYNIGRNFSVPPLSIVIGKEASSMALENRSIPYRSSPPNFNKSHYSEELFWEKIPQNLEVHREYPIEKKNGVVRLAIFKYDEGSAKKQHKVLH